MTNLMQSIRARQLRYFEFDRGTVLARVVQRLAKRRAPGMYSTLWTDAVYGWDNEEWSADELYLAEVVRSAELSTGSILECGSGLTTLLMGVVAARRGLKLHSLEHNEEWHARVSQVLRDFGATTTTEHFAPLRDYGDFDWYGAPLESMPSDFTLVVCDGPPASTRGGRSGMLPTMRSKLGPSCSVLLDDANRPAEQELVRSWSKAGGGTTKINKSHRGFARVAL